VTEGRVIAVARGETHGFSKVVVQAITIRAGLGVESDAHAGVTVKHRSRVRVDPSQPNLRQVHLIQAELFAEVAAKGFAIAPGQLGENITTHGLDLLALPRGAVLAIGATVRLEVTGLRNPCAQIEAFQPGLLAAVLCKADDGTLVRKSGIMAIVAAGGTVRAGDAIRTILPDPPFLPLERV
jgi:MOSC domain-containing protein YiiM